MKRLLLLLVFLIPAIAGATDVVIQGNTYTLQDHPRVFLDGSAGTVTARVKDPDGAGAGVAPQATDANPAFVGLKTMIRSCRASPSYCSSNPERKVVVLMGALDWFMDNSQTESLDMAKHWLASVEAWIESTDSWACDIRDGSCGHASWHSWPPFDMILLAQAYSLIQSEMSAPEKLDFYQKMFNDDDVYYEDGCDNLLQRIEAVTGVAVTTGSTAVTATSGFTGNVSNGDRLYFRSPTGWATVSTVNSDTSLTLTGPVKTSVLSNTPTITNGRIYKRNAWTSTSCGLAWALGHHLYTPAYATDQVNFTHTSSYTTGTTSITANSVAGLPAPPFYIRATYNGEVMKVTAINGLVMTVERGQLFGGAQNGGYPPSGLQYSPYVPNAAYTDYGSNNPLQNVTGLLAMSLALADEGPNATRWVRRAADTWLVKMYPIAKDLLTGFNQSGGTDYGPGRWHTEVHMITTALAMIPAGGAPSLDKRAGHWLAYPTYAYLYTLLPGTANIFMGWGQPDIAASPDYNGHLWGYFQTYLLGETAAASKHWNYWNRNMSQEYADVSPSANGRHNPFSLFYWQESDPEEDFRTVLPTERAFNLSDGIQNKALQMWISRTGWTASTDTLVFANAWGTCCTTDHIGPGSPGSYKIYKSGYQLSENGLYDTGSGADSNMLVFGTTYTAASPDTMLLDRADADSASPSSWSYARMNMQGVYASSSAVTRAIRNLVHFKKASSQDYLVAYDTAATSAAKNISQSLWFDKTSGQTSTMTSQAVPSLVWTGPTRRLNTAVVLPAGNDVFAAYTSGVNSHKMKLCASTDGATCANATSAEFLVVHMPTTSATSTAPTIATLGTIDQDFVGVQIEDATAPSVAIFSKLAADQVTGSFTTTHAGTARYVVTGLAAGTYDVTRGGSGVLDDEVVGTDGALTFESVAGAFTLAEGTAPPPSITVTTTSLPNGVVGVAYSQQLSYTGGTGAVTWTKTGTLCAGLTLSAAGLISGTPTTPETCAVTYTVTDSASPTPQTNDRALSITIETPAPPCSITTTSPLPNGVRNVAYSQQLVTSGCTAPLTWSTLVGTHCNGLTLSSGGVLSGTPTTVETCSFTARVVDNVAAPDNQDLQLTIDAPPPDVLQITTTSPLGDCVQNQACSTTFTSTGGTQPVTWSKQSGTYCVGNDTLTAATGLLSGVPTVVETCTFTMLVTDSASPTPQTDTQEVQRTITGIAPTLSVVATPGSTSVTVQFGTPILDVNQACDIVVSSSAISADGYVEFTVAETNTSRMLGLSNGNTNTSYTDLDFGLYVRSLGDVEVWEGGVIKGTFGAYATSDTMRVSVEGGVVRYSKNGTIFYTSTAAPTYPLLVDTALFTQGATLNDVVISAGFAAEAVVWTTTSGVTVDTNSLTKTASSAWGNAGAVSTAEIDSGHPFGPVAQTTSPSGPATRSVSLSGLVPSTHHTLEVTCGTVASGQDSFTTTAASAGPTVTWTYKLRPSTRLTDRGVTNALVSYNVVGEAADTLSSGCLTGCEFSLPLLSQSETEIQHVWRLADDVIWTDDLGVTVDGNSLTKTAGGPAWGNAGAVSTQELASGDGYVESTAIETDTMRVFGLNNGSPFNYSWDEIDFTIQLYETGYVVARENGTQMAVGPAYVTGDKASVGVEGGVVKYRHNGVVFYTSLVAPTYPLLVNAALNHPGSTLSDVVVVFETSPPATVATSRKGTVAVP